MKKIGKVEENGWKKDENGKRDKTERQSDRKWKREDKDKGIRNGECRGRKKRKR